MVLCSTQWSKGCLQETHGTPLDTHHQEAVCEADLNAAQQRGDLGAVCWQV